MRQSLSILLLLSFISCSLFGMDQKDSQLTSPAEFPSTRALLDQGNYSWFLMPMALVADIYAKIKEQIVAGEKVITHISEAIDTLRYDYTGLEIYNMAWEGYRKRLEQIKPYIKDLKLEAHEMNMLVFACTAWDSKNESPKALILAGGQKLKRKILLNHNAELGTCFLSLYDRIAQASSYIKSDPVLNNLSFEQFMSALSSKTPSVQVQNLNTHLSQAAKELQEILHGLLAR